MGWYFGDDTMGSMIKDLTKPVEGGNLSDGRIGNRVTLARCIRGMNLHVLFEVHYSDGSKFGPYGVSYLMKNGGGDHGWGYKPLGILPDFPLSYLNRLAPCDADDKYETEARDECREYHAKQAEKRALTANLKPGDVLVLRSGCSPNRVTYYSRRGKSLYASGYRVNPKLVVAVERQLPEVEAA